MGIKFKLLITPILWIFTVFSKAWSERIIYGKNITYQNEDANTIFLDKLIPSFNDLINSDGRNETQRNITNKIIEIDSDYTEMARNISNSVKLIHISIFNKTRAFLLPFITETEENHFKEFNWKVNNSIESGIIKFNNSLPLNITFLRPGKILLNSSKEESGSSNRVFIPYLRGGVNVKEKLFDSNLNKYANKEFNATMIGVNKYEYFPNNFSESETNSTALRSLQFTSLFGMNYDDNFGFYDPNEIPGVSDGYFLIQEYYFNPGENDQGYFDSSPSDYEYS
ncbi:putative secreted protein, signal peptide [Cryptosporidium felis]|nr:putative secreted protein, signal peptide [Cryptosporidium felis]